MSISKANLITEVARRTGRNSSDVTDYEIRAGLQSLSMDVPSLAGEYTCATEAGRANYDLRSLPARFKRLEAVRIDDGDNDATFDKIRSFEEYQTLIADEESTDYEEPSAYIIWNDTLYIYPTPDDTYTLRLFALIFERNEDSIAMPEDLEEPLISLICYEVLKNKGLGNTDEATGHRNSAAIWVNKFNKLENEKIPPKSIAYNDI